MIHDSSATAQRISFHYYSITKRKNNSRFIIPLSSRKRLDVATVVDEKSACQVSRSCPPSKKKSGVANVMVFLAYTKTVCTEQSSPVYPAKHPQRPVWASQLPRFEHSMFSEVPLTVSSTSQTESTIFLAVQTAALAEVALTGTARSNTMLLAAMDTIL